ncbi:hypothetical protein E5673_08950 [Sphingomonas sp. PAMC26645]|uniref:hypothetical protein n=1 Tax=Sphingomonas sp. PAMC26645 TaxID=2565555 RepID=UPI00109E1563|nr:hypothetical protein [Sphingomonas sp. PAMC26645]QCB42342.1 hypothetical protein E5673_08950 [Sphingomonas sp. PAMC26645]
MTPTDATNLLLGLMYDDAQDAVALNVPHLRAATLQRSEGSIGFDYGGGTVSHAPPHDFVTDEQGVPFNLGTAIELIFDQLVRFGTIDWDLEEGSNSSPDDLVYVTNFSLEVSRPGHSAKMWLDAHAVHWDLNYHRTDPEYAARRDAAVARGELVPNELAHLNTFMTRSRGIRDGEIYDLADVLRGTPMPDQMLGTDNQPPYGSWEPAR